MTEEKKEEDWHNFASLKHPIAWTIDGFIGYGDGCFKFGNGFLFHHLKIDAFEPVTFFELTFSRLVGKHRSGRLRCSEFKKIVSKATDKTTTFIVKNVKRIVRAALNGYSKQNLTSLQIEYYLTSFYLAMIIELDQFVSDMASTPNELFEDWTEELNPFETFPEKAIVVNEVRKTCKEFKEKFNFFSDKPI